VLAATSAFAVSHHHEHKQVMQMMNDCPIKIQGMKVAASDTPNGVALTFSTGTGDVAELRRRIERMAEMYKMQSDGRDLMLNGHFIPGTAEFEATRNGARLTLIPKDPARLEEFRAQVPEHAEMMRNAACSKTQR
jgi:hypothetical protein